MSRSLIFMVAMLQSSFAMAAMTWSTPSTYVSLLAETTGTGSAPGTSTQGLGLAGLQTVQVCVEPVAGSSLTAGSLQAYLWNGNSSGPDGGYSGMWQRAPDLDLTVPASGSAGYGSCFLGINVKANASRLAYVPSGLGVSNKTWITGFRQ